jgi:hypothetical protein
MLPATLLIWLRTLGYVIYYRLKVLGVLFNSQPLTTRDLEFGLVIT